MTNPLFNLAAKRKAGLLSGIPSFCCSNRFVIEAIFEQSKRFDDKVLIEATSNQVNQFGGYIGMKPADFRDYIYGIADKVGYDKSNIILGGDHLGPQPWQDLPESTAIEYSKELVRQCVLAGFTKIHLDTSMRVADDDRNLPLSNQTIAHRGAILMKTCEETFTELKNRQPDAVHPVFIIGSEVPIPGGAQQEEKMHVTSQEDFASTIEAYKKEFAQFGIADLFKYVIAVVVQPGVEFGDGDVHKYNRMDAYPLTQKLKEYPNLVFEGHSTDYQSAHSLREMVEDGIAILKVGPALTFAARRGLFALAKMEDELIDDADSRSHFIQVLDDVMVENPKDWKKYYHGTDKEIALARKYSYSDRCRYYMGDARVQKAIATLINNLKDVDIPMGMLEQYMPIQFIKVRDGRLAKTPEALVKDCVLVVIEDYNYATKHNYMISSIFNN
jgi:D-tagatose-1,6-bisphosphate aldolase subunit GatZ/KbaZ